MTLGPFAPYMPPAVYTRTLTESNVASLFAGLRIPTLIGVGQEELDAFDLELVRGSSSTIDQNIVNEDVTLSWVVDGRNPSNPILGANDGNQTTLRVRNFPIVDGQGFGRVTNDVKAVTVTVNGIPVAVGAVRGATGEVVLQVPPQASDVVRVSYFFHRGDTLMTDDVSGQVSVEPANLITPGFEPFSVVSGTSDTLKLKVNGAEKSVVFTPSSAATAASLKTQIDAAQISGLTTVVFSANDGKSHLRLIADVSVEILDGSANGILGFQSGTKTARTSAFRVFQRPIVDGSSGGITTTDPSKVTVKVNGLQVIPTAVDGKNGVVSLANAPAAGSTVTVTYYTNTWQDTFDYLPNTNVTNVVRAGISPGRNDYIQGQDFVVSNPSSDVSIVHWGASVEVAATKSTAGAEVFDSSQIIPTLVDDRLYLAECSRFVNSAVVPAVTSKNEFLLPEVPTTGNGRDTPLGADLYASATNGRIDLATNRPDLIEVRTGRDLSDALGRPAAKVVSVDGRKVTLAAPVPPDHKAFATFWYSRLSDDTFSLTCKVAGAVGAGQYEVYSSLLNSNLYQVKFTGKSSLPETVQWPRGVEQVPDAFHVGGAPVSEIVTVTFGQTADTAAVYTNKGAAPYSFYSQSANWRTALNGNGTLVTNLLTAAKAYLVGSGVEMSGGNLVVSSGAETLELTIDGNDITVTLPTGTLAVGDIVDAINVAIGANLCAVYTSGTKAFFVIESASTPSSLPAGFDSKAQVSVRQGTAEATLGFKTFQKAVGTPGAVNKPATLLSSKAEPFSWTAGIDDTFKVRVNGVDFSMTLSATSAAGVRGEINAVVSNLATVGTLDNVGKVRLTSSTNADNSSIVILDGTANAVLGFAQGDYASQSRVDAQEVVDRLMATAGFTDDAVAYVTEASGQKYVTIESLVTGSSSSISFVDGSNSAFNILCGTGITPGSDGDNGEDASDMFEVTSTNALGSAGTGVPGQTYTDARTGLRFSVLPSVTGSYSAGGSFDLEVSPTFDVNPSVPSYAIPGAELIVSNTVGIGVDDTARVQTYNPSGVEPKNGDFYFISYRYLKQDFSTRIFRQFKTIEANYGRLSAENRVTLGAYLAIQNGAVLVGIKQVLKVPNTNQASAKSFVDAIQELATPLPGNVKPDILVPLSTDTAVYSYLTQHCEIMSNIRNQSERMGMIGFASGTSPSTAQAIARGLKSNRIVALYPDSAVITLQNELGETFETRVDGTFFAAAMAGSAVSPAVDVATPYTRRRIQGFTRIPRILDAVEANQTAVAGITLLEDLDPVIRVRQGLTTNMDSVLTRLPTVTQISDHVMINVRSVLDAFIGTKFLASRVNDVEVTMTSLFKQLQQQEIVGAWTGISASVDPEDPTTLRAEAYYQPIFPLLYIIVTMNLRARL